MTVKEHYENHLAEFYSWMAGDFEEKQKEHQLFLESLGIKPVSTKLAVDLGAGHGIQSVSLAKLGFRVTSVDFNNHLLTALKNNGNGLDIEAVEGDIRLFNKYITKKPELIVCWGDTLTHLGSLKEIEQLVIDCCEALTYTGKLILSFRDYSVELIGDNRFIPVKSDDKRILTCFLEYFPDNILVTDLLHEKDGTGWKQKISSYKKTRVSVSVIKNCLASNGMKITYDGIVNRLNTIVAEKG